MTDRETELLIALGKANERVLDAERRAQAAEGAIAIMRARLVAAEGIARQLTTAEMSKLTKPIRYAH